MKKEKINPMFPLGIVFIGAGVVFTTSINVAVGIPLLALGTVYLVIGIKNEKKKKR